MAVPTAPVSRRQRLLGLLAGLDAADRAELRRLLDEVDGPQPSDRVAAPSDALERPRLLRQLAQRADIAVTTVIGRAGSGKTTLLRQAAADPIAVDSVEVIVEARADDDAGAFTHRIVVALAERGATVPAATDELDALLNALWSLSPRLVCLMLDDLHRLPDDVARAVLGPLLSRRTANVRIVMSSRRPVPVGLETFRHSGQLFSLDDRDLAFADAERAQLASRYGRRPQGGSATRLAADVELEARLGRSGVAAADLDDIVGQMEPARVAVVAPLAVAGYVDDELAAALCGIEASAGELMADLPLVHRQGARFEMHDLLRDCLRRRLPIPQIHQAGTRAATVLMARGDLTEALDLALELDLDEVLCAIARTLALDFVSSTSASDAAGVLRRLPARLAERVEVLALDAAVQFALRPLSASYRLSAVVAASAAVGDVDTELHGLLRLGELAFRSSGVDSLAALSDRLSEMPDGEPRVCAVRAMVLGWRYLLGHRYAEASEVLDGALAYAYPPVTELSQWYQVVWWGWLGHCELALSKLEGLAQRPGGRYASRMAGYVAIQKWLLGQLRTSDRRRVREVVDDLERMGETHLFVEGAATTALFFLTAGDVQAGEALISRAAARRDELHRGHWGSIVLAQAEAVAAVQRGDETEARRLLIDALPAPDPLAGLAGHVTTLTVAVTYVLAPGAADTWESMELGPQLALARDVGRAMVKVRRGEITAAVELPWGHLARLRPFAPEPWLCELALAAVASGDRRAESALAQLRGDPVAAMAQLEHHPSNQVAHQARARVGSVPRRPQTTLTIRALGSLEVERGADQLRLSRKGREILAVLVEHRCISRREMASLLWPDKTPGAAANNLRVTLSDLHRLLEPERPAFSTPWHVRTIDDQLELTDSEWLVIDVDELEDTFEQARRHDRAGRPGAALDAFRRGCALVRGEYLETMWWLPGAGDRATQVRTDFVRAATRAAELLSCVGADREALEMASRAAELAPTDERLHLALATALAGLGAVDDGVATIDRLTAGLRNAGVEVPARVLEARLRLAR